MIGESSITRKGNSTPAATEMPRTLYMNAPNRFCFILPRVTYDISIAVTTPRNLPPTNVTSDASIATSVPVPMAKPI
jgi:hypothetical protein